MIRYTNLPDNKDKIFGGAYSVHDWETCKFRDFIIQEYVYKPSDPDLIKEEFISTYREWMASTHNLIGIEKFSAACLLKEQRNLLLNFIFDIKLIKGLDLKRENISIIK